MSACREPADSEDELSGIDPRRPTLKTAPGGPALQPHYEFGLALSGGGHRAALFGLGVVLALRDSQRLPSQISSVSGGSITNMMLAAGGSRSDQLASEEDWAALTEEIFDRVRRGSLTTLWLVLLAGLLLLLPVGVVLVAAMVRGGALPAVVLATAWLWLLVARGQVVERLMARRYLGTARPAFVKLADPSHRRQNVVCCTDLVLGRPVYFAADGRVFRRTTDRAGGDIPGNLRLRTDADGTPIRDGTEIKATESLPASAVLRASAAFPGIPPRKLRWRRISAASPADRCGDENRRVVEDGRAASMDSLALLSDGGVWNNLATEPFEDGFFTDSRFVVLVADASAGLRPVRSWPFTVPVLAEFLAFGRQASIQNTNTVGPRRRTQNDNVFRELRFPGSARFTQERLYPLVSIIDTPETIHSAFRLRVPEDDVYQHAYDSVGYTIQAWQERRVKTQERIRVLPGDERFKRLQTLSAPPTGDADPVSSYPTTLGRLPRRSAAEIVARGYANTVVTLYLTGLRDELAEPMPGHWLTREVR